MFNSNALTLLYELNMNTVYIIHTVHIVTLDGLNLPVFRNYWLEVERGQNEYNTDYKPNVFVTVNKLAESTTGLQIGPVRVLWTWNLAKVSV